jgi:hypothetical protein
MNSPLRELFRDDPRVADRCGGGEPEQGRLGAVTEEAAGGETLGVGAAEGEMADGCCRESES